MLIKATINFLHLAEKSAWSTSSFDETSIPLKPLRYASGGRRRGARRSTSAVDPLPAGDTIVRSFQPENHRGTKCARRLNPINALDYLDYYAAMPFPTINYNYPPFLQSSVQCRRRKLVARDVAKVAVAGGPFPLWRGSFVLLGRACFSDG